MADSLFSRLLQMAVVAVFLGAFADVGHVGHVGHVGRVGAVARATICWPFLSSPG